MDITRKINGLNYTIKLTKNEQYLAFLLQSLNNNYDEIVAIINGIPEEKLKEKNIDRKELLKNAKKMALETENLKYKNNANLNEAKWIVNKFIKNKNQ